MCTFVFQFSLPSLIFSFALPVPWSSVCISRLLTLRKKEYLHSESVDRREKGQRKNTKGWGHKILKSASCVRFNIPLKWWLRFCTNNGGLHCSECYCFKHDSFAPCFIFRFLFSSYTSHYFSPLETRNTTMNLFFILWKKFMENWKVAGSIPDGVIGIFHWHKILPIALWPWGRLSL